MSLKPSASIQPDTSLHTDKPLVIMVSAGEASGDEHAAHAIKAFVETQANTSIEFFGMGGQQLQAAGCELVVDCTDLAVMGFVEVLANYHRFLKRLKTLRQALIQRQPDLLLLVDFPDFNLKLAETAKQQGIPVLFYVSPQIWAWRSGRIHRIGQLVDHVACLLPFEPAYYEKAGIAASYVGNPVVEQRQRALTRNTARDELGLAQDATVIGLLPGSRMSELQRLLPVQLQAAALLKTDFPECEFVLPRASTLPLTAVQTLLDASTVPVRLVEERSKTVMHAADALICASGTATLESALALTPLVVVYRTGAINYWIMSRLIEIDHISLVNIIAGKTVVVELIQQALTAEAIHAEIKRVLTDEDYRQQMIQALSDVGEKLGEPGASHRVAKLMRSLLGINPAAHPARSPE